jgi:hypothetical protein
MDFYRQYSLPIGLLCLALILVLLLSSPQSMFSQQVSFIDTEIDQASGSAVTVRTKMDFGDSRHVRAFPMEIDEWDGFDYDTAATEELLGADVILLRAYHKPSLNQPLFLTIMQAETETSFHPPTVCFPAQGYKVAEEGKDTILVSNADWAEKGAPKEVPVRKLVAFKEEDGVVTERRVVIYYYVKGNPIVSHTITMIQVSALAPTVGPYDEILGEVKGFAALTLPYMFDPYADKDGDILLLQIIHWGPGGYLILILMLLAPLAIMFYPPISRARQRRVGTGQSET